MNIVESLINWLKRNKEPNTTDAPEGLCPNCWGRTEYGGQFYEAVRNENIDANTASTKVGWVQDYANKHLTAIQLKEEEGELVCSKCKVTYRPA